MLPDLSTIRASGNQIFRLTCNMRLQTQSNHQDSAMSAAADGVDLTSRSVALVVDRAATATQKGRGRGNLVRDFRAEVVAQAK